MPYRRPATRITLIPLSLLLVMVWGAKAVAEIPDPRAVFGKSSPQWLQAVGKLQVPGVKTVDGKRGHHLEDCSATLVAKESEASADIIVTAWHCLEFYSDLSKPILFTLLPGSVSPITSEAYRLADGGGMHADWALLKLYRPVATQKIQPLALHPARARESETITMAGYSSDEGLGESGNKLTYDARCFITEQNPSSGNSNCRAYKGASGGAVVQLSEAGEALLSGVISQGDGQSVSVFVPVASFRGALGAHL